MTPKEFRKELRRWLLANMLFIHCSSECILRLLPGRWGLNVPMCSRADLEEIKSRLNALGANKDTCAAIVANMKESRENAEVCHTPPIYSTLLSCVPLLFRTCCSSQRLKQLMIDGDVVIVGESILICRGATTWIVPDLENVSKDSKRSNSMREMRRALRVLLFFTALTYCSDRRVTYDRSTC